MALAHTRRVSPGSPCPVCHKPTWCLVATDGSYAVCMRVTSDRPARGRNGGYVHRLGPRPAGGRATDLPPPLPRTHDVSSAAPLEVRDKVYRRLLAASNLKRPHRDDLDRRGCSPEEIAGRYYRTLPLRGRSRIAAKCVNGDAKELAGVPGFYVAEGADGQWYWQLAGSPGLLIPCRAPDGRIRGLRIRPDDPGGGGKYRWLSSAKRQLGVSSGAHCHVARPLAAAPARAAAWVVEGELKADLAAERLGAVVLSVPGVDLWPLALPDLAEVLPAGGRLVVAMDADWREKVRVHEAAWGLALAGRACGYSVEVALWAPAHKGLDDLLTAGLTPATRPPEAIPPPAWPIKLTARVLAEVRPRNLPATVSLQAVRKELAAAFRGRPCPCT